MSKRTDLYHILPLCITATAMSLMPLAGIAGDSGSLNTASNTMAGKKNISIDPDTFIQEIKDGHIDNVRFFLSMGANAGIRNHEGTSALLAAMELPSDEILKLLLQHMTPGAQSVDALNIADKDGKTALFKAIEQNRPELAEQFISLGANPNLGSKAATTPLMLAVNQKNEGLVKKILEAMKTTDPARDALLSEDTRGNTALSYAILANSAPVTKLLLEAGASASKADTIGITPLMHAAQTGDDAIGTLLLEAGADVTAVNKSGENALLIALKKGNGPLARLLLQKMKEGNVPVSSAILAAALETPGIDETLFNDLLASAPASEQLPHALLFKALDIRNNAIAKTLLARTRDVNIRNDQNETLFYHAIDSGFEDIVLELLQRGVDTGQAGASGATAISRAVQHNMARVVTALLEKGASPDQKTSEGYTLAEMCVYNGYPETLEVLLAKGVKMDMEFALLWSIRDGKGKAAPVLLARGAVPNIMNQDGTPAITLAAEAGQLEAVNAFIKHKATIDYPSKNRGITALGAAALAGQMEIVKALVEAGAAIEAKDNAGMTPLAHAASLSRVAVVEYLLGKGANMHAVDAQKRSVNDIAGLAASSADRTRVMQLLADALKK